MTNPTYRIVSCHHIRVQTPELHVVRLLAAVLTVDPLVWGDYDQVSFTTAAGLQRFRTLPGARNRATGEAESVPCVELSFVVPEQADLAAILTALAEAHAYEEPVIVVTSAVRTLHHRGTGEDAPNRFWNQPAEDWVPTVHR